MIVLFKVEVAFTNEPTTEKKKKKKKDKNRDAEAEVKVEETLENPDQSEGKKSKKKKRDKETIEVCDNENKSLEGKLLYNPKMTIYFKKFK